jgi:hypothetical protein
MDPGEESFHYALRPDLDPSEPGHFLWIEQIDSRRGHRS